MHHDFLMVNIMAFHFEKAPFHFGRVFIGRWNGQLITSLLQNTNLQFIRHNVANISFQGIPFVHTAALKIVIMLTTMLLAVGLICFWLFYKSIDFFENI
jgi:hypothetical protein